MYRSYGRSGFGYGSSNYASSPYEGYYSKPNRNYYNPQRKEPIRSNYQKSNSQNPKVKNGHQRSNYNYSKSNPRYDQSQKTYQSRTTKNQKVVSQTVNIQQPRRSRFGRFARAMRFPMMFMFFRNMTRRRHHPTAATTATRPVSNASLKNEKPHEFNHQSEGSYRMKREEVEEVLDSERY